MSLLSPSNWGIYWSTKGQTRLIAAPAEEPAQPAMLVPYEWWDAKWEASPQIHGHPRTRILVLWVADDAFAHFPLHRLADLLSWFQWKTANGPESIAGPDVIVLGPESSDTLEQMVKEAGETQSPQALDSLAKARLSSTRIYSCMAVAADSVLMRGKPSSSCEDFINHRVRMLPPFTGQFELLRTVLTDEQLAGAAYDELKLRGVKMKSGSDKPDDIAIISEQDTLYARAAQQAFMEQLAGYPHVQRLSTEREWPLLPDCDWIHPYTYFRGIDGELPSDQTGQNSKNAGNGEPDSDAGESNSDGSGEGGSKQTRDKSNGTGTEGLNQADYLERLCDQIAELNESLQREGRSLKAVGVLGSDVYDKLEILEALRPKLRGTLFFTNHLDARYALADEWSAARNLLVFSSYGLELNEHYQRGVPPFRDSFQTAIYEATLEAMDVIKGSKVDTLGDPRVFQIARTHPFDLSKSWAPLHPKPDLLDRYWGAEVHPAFGPAWTLRRRDWALLAVALAIALCAWTWWSTGHSTQVDEQEEQDEQEQTAAQRGWEELEREDPLGLRFFLNTTPPPRWFILAGLIKRAEKEELEAEEPFCSRLIRLYWWLPVTAICAIAIVWCKLGDRQRFPLEPFSFTDGISIFPTLIIGHIAALLSVYFIAKGYLDLKKNTWHICKKFKLYRIQRKWNSVNWSQFYWPESSHPQHAPGEHQTCDMAALWETYQERGMFLWRMCRVIPMSLLYLAAVSMLVSMLGQAGLDMPARGHPLAHSLWWLISKPLSFMLMISPIVLCFFVIDATRLQAEFVRRCREAPSAWPPRTSREYSYFDRYIGKEDLARYLDIRFIAMRTEAVNNLIYYPFIFIFLTVLSRIDYFDDFARPTARTIIEGLYLLLALYCAYRLPKLANDYRDETVKKLKRSLNSAIIDKCRKRKQVLRQVIYKIQNLDEGAFVSFWEQPAIRAILLPSGSIGIWTLLQYLPHG